MSDRIAVMLDGRVEQLADPDTIYDDPASAFVAGFIGKQNFFEGTAKDNGTLLEGDGWTIRSTLEPVGVLDGGAALAAVRPEAILVSDDRPADGQNAVSGTLASVSHLGDVIQFVILTPGRKEVIARLPRPRAPRLEVGSQVWCTWDASHTHMFGAQQAEFVLVDPAAEAAAVAAE
jgi:spermidine/putrescine transport system ATP-binding protein